MKASVDSKNCWGCGLCEATCPEVFRIEASDDRAHAYAEPTDSTADNVKKAAEECPAKVIQIWD
ncbi:MAG: ferredoxin [Anaerovoracaceae bacterium]|nr:ferredoxin [Bacillota bacterium]MDY2671282.1 ferredoxin [Anaerovoracaceae bacterium]